MRQHYPLNSNGAEDAGQMPWTDGVPSTGAQGSYPGHAIVTDAEAEILAAIDASGQMRNGADLAQLIQAVARGVYLGQFSGTANALAAVIPNNVVFRTLQPGTRFSGLVATTNTGGVTVQITGIGSAAGNVQAALLRRDGAALQAGDLPVGAAFDFRFDGAAFRLTAPAASEITLSIKTYLLGQPPVLQLFCDPVSGDDTRDGLTVGTARKSLDAILDGLGTTATNVILLNDATIRRRRNVYPALSIYGAQSANTAQGWSFAARTVTLLATADNSPQANVGSFCSGFWLYSTNFFTSYINFVLPDQVAGQDYVAHISSDYGTNVTLQLGSIRGTSNNTGYLFWSRANPLFVFLSGMTFGAFGAGHIFQGIGAGSDPNAVYNYKSNVTSA